MTTYVQRIIAFIVATLRRGRSSRGCRSSDSPQGTTALRDFDPVYVGLGSRPVMRRCRLNVRFAPDSGRREGISWRPKYCLLWSRAVGKPACARWVGDHSRPTYRCRFRSKRLLVRSGLIAGKSQNVWIRLRYTRSLKSRSGTRRGRCSRDCAAMDIQIIGRKTHPPTSLNGWVGCENDAVC
jgi:hypothetical protein